MDTWHIKQDHNAKDSVFKVYTYITKTRYILLHKELVDLPLGILIEFLSNKSDPTGEIRSSITDSTQCGTDKTKSIWIDWCTGKSLS
jgi:hypothetical protein